VKASGMNPIAKGQATNMDKMTLQGRDKSSVWSVVLVAIAIFLAAAYFAGVVDNSDIATVETANG
jgi:hypothetical protein